MAVKGFAFLTGQEFDWARTCASGRNTKNLFLRFSLKE